MEKKIMKTILRTGVIIEILDLKRTIIARLQKKSLYLKHTACFSEDSLISWRRYLIKYDTEINVAKSILQNFTGMMAIVDNEFVDNFKRNFKYKNVFIGNYLRIYQNLETSEYLIIFEDLADLPEAL